MLQTANFIKPNLTFDRNTVENIAPIFRKTFTLDTVKPATLAFACLGMGQVWLNGHRVNRDLFGTDEAGYDQTIWYDVIDVTAYLRPGKNVLSALCGNGTLNEPYGMCWSLDTPRYRDNPKLIAALLVDGHPVLTTDGSWKCFTDGPIVSNIFRVGEQYDARREADFHAIDFDDSAWPCARMDNTPPHGVFRQTFIPPLIEAEVLDAVEIRPCNDGWLYDFGRNIPGYARLSVAQNPGDQITLFYAEHLEDGKLINPVEPVPVPGYQTDFFICSGKPCVYSPSFTYHGFRYIYVTGLRQATREAVKAVFIHQDISQTATFTCSNEKLNRLYNITVEACYSNFVRKITDCPTREKHGWSNDLQSSCENLITHFDIADYYRKHIQDAIDTMRPDGMMSCVVTTGGGYGYDWGNGPVSEGVVFELCHQIYRYTGDPKPLIDALPYLLRNLQNYRDQSDETGFAAYGLPDWASPTLKSDVPVQLLNGALFTHFLKITALAARLSGNEALAAQLDAERTDCRRQYMSLYLTESGECAVDAMTAVAMTIFYGLYEDLEPLKVQLMRQVESHDFHLDCGMVGTRRLYWALNQCGLPDYAYRILTAEGFPGYFHWLDQGAVTLWEMWNCEGWSRNHHMYSDFMQWLIKTLCGIQVLDEYPGLSKVRIAPYFEPSLTHCRASMRTPFGDILSGWERKESRVQLRFTIPEGCAAIYDSTEYPAGTYEFEIDN